MDGSPIAPMLARQVGAIPPGMAYEPKWDGWRCIIARDVARTRLWSRRGSDLAGFFPEIVDACAALPARCVLDGELVVLEDGRLQYTRLANRHASAARAASLAAQFPASFVAFDVLGFEDVNLMDQPWHVRREVLDAMAEQWQPPLLLSPVTRDREVAQRWFTAFEAAGLDGVVAKPLDQPYQPGVRAVFKVKHRRTADVVVAGFRLDRTHTPARPSLGSVLLGLYDEAGVLHHIGVAAAFPGDQRAELARLFAELEVRPGEEGYDEHPWSEALARQTGARVPDSVTRWSAPREEAHLIWPPLVCEVSYDALHDRVRLRSNASFVRWRPDRDPESCRFDQLASPPGQSLTDALGLDA